MKSIRVIIINIVFGIQLTGCLSGSLIPNPTLTVSETVTPLQLLTKTPASTITPTDTPVPTASWTPLPTIPPSEFPDRLLDLMDSNAGCELPCWWGIVPGETTTAEALYFLTQFPMAIGELRTQEVFYKGESHNTSAFGFSIDIPSKLMGTIDVFSSDETVVSILVHLEQYRKNYQLEQLLKSFGKPSEVYFSAQASSPIAKLAPTIFILDYREKGILVWYEYPTIRIADNLQFCSNSEMTSFELWDPGLDVYSRFTVDEYIDIITGFPSKRLADATTFTLDSFYETFVNSGSGKCIETPANLWP